MMTHTGLAYGAASSQQSSLSGSPIPNPFSNQDSPIPNPDPSPGAFQDKGWPSPGHCQLRYLPTPRLRYYVRAARY
eukprot:1196987-Rhodomonas_salina.2